MTTIVGVRKNGRVAIAADSQTSFSRTLLSGEDKATPSKIIRVSNAYIGLVGSVANMRVLESVSTRHPELFSLDSTSAIFESLRALQPILEREYYVRTEENDRNQEYDSNQLYGILISKGGLFTFHTYREVTGILTFWATGSGSDYALGAMESIYRSNLSAKVIAEPGVQAACKFDSGSGLPLYSHSMKLSDKL